MRAAGWWKALLVVEAAILHGLAGEPALAARGAAAIAPRRVATVASDLGRAQVVAVEEAAPVGAPPGEAGVAA